MCCILHLPHRESKVGNPKSGFCNRKTSQLPSPRARAHTQSVSGIQVGCQRREKWCFLALCPPTISEDKVNKRTNNTKTKYKIYSKLKVEQKWFHLPVLYNFYAFRMLKTTGLRKKIKVNSQATALSKGKVKKTSKAWSTQEISACETLFIHHVLSSLVKQGQIEELLRWRNCLSWLYLNVILHNETKSIQMPSSELK